MASHSIASPAPPAAAVRRFEELSRTDIPYAGGKGANLGELAGAGIPVPPGFVVGVPAFAAFCDAGGLRDRIAARLDGVDVEETPALEAAAADVRAMVAREAMPAWLEAALREAYAVLGGGEQVAVAVRSSATSEDTGSASFAGMNETFLNVRGADEVVAAVARCWASLFGARTVYYRAKRGFEQAGMNIAVVVQRQVRRC